MEVYNHEKTARRDMVNAIRELSTYVFDGGFILAHLESRYPYTRARWHPMGVRTRGDKGGQGETEEIKNARMLQLCITVIIYSPPSLRWLLQDYAFARKNKIINCLSVLQMLQTYDFMGSAVTNIENQQTTTAEDAATSAAGEFTQALANEEHRICSTTTVTIAK
ncbi:hypothetical protein PV325_012592 [Microctonus aethiopoides]|nr:hypothetical protein PV325_012592 [Microctonus aethiopoides]